MINNFLIHKLTSPHWLTMAAEETAEEKVDADTLLDTVFVKSSIFMLPEESSVTMRNISVVTLTLKLNEVFDII